MISRVFDSVKKDDLACLEGAIRSGCSINETDRSHYQFTILHVACLHRRIKIVEWLLREGADVCVRNSKGWTPLHISCIKGDLQVTQVLIKNGADVNAIDGRGCTPGHLAAAHNNPHVLHLLLRCGLKFDCKDKREWTLAHYVCYHGNDKCLQIIQQTPLHQPNSDGNTPLHLACRNGHLSCAKELLSLSNGVWSKWISTKNFEGNTAKREAIEGRRGAVVSYMEALEKQTFTEPINQDSSFPAHLAARSGDLDHLRRLVEGGVVDIEETDAEGNSLLHKAIGHVRIVEWLLERGANVDASNYHGETSLDVAGRMGERQCYNFIIEYLEKNRKSKHRNKNSWKEADYSNDYLL